MSTENIKKRARVWFKNLEYFIICAAILYSYSKVIELDWPALYAYLLLALLGISLYFLFMNILIITIKYHPEYFLPWKDLKAHAKLDDKPFIDTLFNGFVSIGAILSSCIFVVLVLALQFL